ncbi:MAG: hypothetical protein QNK04_09355 [Myxococcota bacterium]|nr:hypothetical protein [Myxococcota bacterium]
MRRILLLLLEFVALSAPLTWLWLEWGQALYGELLFAALDPFYDALGGRHASRSPAGHRYLAYVPFLALMAITPGMALRRRLLSMLAGFALIFLSHVLLTVAVDAANARYDDSAQASSALFPFLLLADGLPFLLWYLFFRGFLHSLVAEARGRQREEPTAGGG